MSIGRTSMLLTPVAALARAVAFFVPVAIARWYGVQAATDAFYWAFSVSTFVLVVGSTAMGTVLVPAVAQMRLRAPDRVPGFLGAAALCATLVASGLGALFAFASPWVLPVASGFDAETRELTTIYCWTLVPFLASIAANAVLKTGCEVHGIFTPPAAAPLIRAGVQLLVLQALLPLGPLSIPAGACAGNFAETIWLWVTLRRAGIRVVPSLSLPPELYAAAAVLGPVLLGEALVALNPWVDKLFAAFMASGSVTLLEYADRAQMIPKTLLESTLVVVAFNAWAAASARGDVSERRKAVASTLWWIMLLAPPVLAGMLIGRDALVKLLYEGGQFAASNTAITAGILGAFLPGVLFALLGALIVKAHIIEGRYRLVMKLGLLSFALNTTFNLLLGPRYGLAGLAAGTSLTTAIITLVSFVRLAPDLKGTVPAAAIRDALFVAGGSAALAGASLAGGFAPSDVWQSSLWVASVPCFVLLAYGLRQVRGGLAS